ncbi:MAG TPA: prepilin-type N-terminal cleavage/methylation domain-containing protein [Planctomycetota bacterium]|nr:prepilin-type N-terminal cleavage/methylation domain-containing protein [Planctomycetota bacterium]
MFRKGFTLLELLMVVVILAILAGITFGLLQAVESAKVRVTGIRIQGLGDQVSALVGTKGFPPATLEELAPKLEKTDWIKDGKFVDAWERPIEYRVDGRNFRIWSCGADGVSGTDDDVEYRRN